MDLNIATAFWFASRGRGYLRAYTKEDARRALSATDNNASLLRVPAAGPAVPGAAKPPEEYNQCHVLSFIFNKVLVFNLIN